MYVSVIYNEYDSKHFSWLTVDLSIYYLIRSGYENDVSLEQLVTVVKSSKIIYGNMYLHFEMYEKCG